MNKFSNMIDRFCSRHRRFGIPRLMLWVVIGTAIVYLFRLMDSSGQFLYYLYFNPRLILRGQVWRLVTYIFIPQSNSILMVISLYFYYFIGSTLERQWGTAKFTLYYLCGIVFTDLYGLIFGSILGAGYIGLTGAYLNLSMFFVFATFYPENRVLLFFIIPLKIKWLAYADAILFALSFILSLVQGQFIAAFLPVVAILNYFIFCGDLLMEQLAGLRRRFDRRQRSNVVNFRKAARQAKAETEGKPYTRKCAVCGRTDADNPDLEFRYCSRCAGYHCFCQDHINNHIHFTE